MATPQPRKRTLLTFDEKRDIIEYSVKHTKCTQQDISNYFTTLWQKPIKRRTVGDILSHKDDLDKSATPTRKRHRSAHHSDMEKALFLWFSQTRANNISVTDDILREKAKKFGEELGITDFKFSNGWLCRFKARHAVSNSRTRQIIRYRATATIRRLQIKQCMYIVSNEGGRGLRNQQEHL